MKSALAYLICVPFWVHGQINTPLKRELDSMSVLDQRYREYLMTIDQNARLTDSLARAFGVGPGDLSGTLWAK